MDIIIDILVLAMDNLLLCAGGAVILALVILAILWLRSGRRTRESDIVVPDIPHYEVEAPRVIPAMPTLMFQEEPGAQEVSVSVPASDTPASQPGAPPPPPPPAPVFSPATNRDDAQILLASFEGVLPQTRPSPIYMLALVMVAICMLLLPAVYFAIVAGAGYITWQHATQNYSILSSYEYSGKQKVLLYFAPLLAGITLVFFLLKPLLAPRGKSAAPVSLDPKREPVFFAFVEKLCRTVGSPMPKRIDVDCNVNAAAGLRSGLWSLMRRGDLVLIVGLPLAQGLDVRLFASVLAHEFGHFGQGLGMRVSYIIRTINHWFARVVYQRDSWDEALVAASEASPGAIGLVVMFVQLIVGTARRILWLLMIIGHAISSFLLRQMEYDADWVAAQLAGSDSIEAVSHRLTLLDLATRGAHAELTDGLKNWALAENYSQLVVDNEKEMPDDLKVLAWEHTLNERPAVFGTHPTAAQRKRAAEKIGAPGMMMLQGFPGSHLFREFDHLARSTSLEFYREVLGRGVQKDLMFPNPVFREKAARAAVPKPVFERR